jgi:putative membrane protein
MAVLAQIAYPLLDGPGQGAAALTAVTVAGVFLFAAATVSHAALTLGARAAVVLVVVAGGIGLLASPPAVPSGSMPTPGRSGRSWPASRCWCRWPG